MGTDAIIGIIIVVALIGFKLQQNARRLKQKNDRIYQQLKETEHIRKTTDD